MKELLKTRECRNLRQRLLNGILSVNHAVLFFNLNSAARLLLRNATKNIFIYFHLAFLFIFCYTVQESYTNWNRSKGMNVSIFVCFFHFSLSFFLAWGYFHSLRWHSFLCLFVWEYSGSGNAGNSVTEVSHQMPMAYQWYIAFFRKIYLFTSIYLFYYTYNNSQKK